jgi:hypothetical protein
VDVNLVQMHRTVSEENVEYVRKLYEAYRAAMRGEGEWPPPIIGYHNNGKVTRADGTHRSAAATMAGVPKIPMYVFKSKDQMLRAMDMGAENPAQAARRAQTVCDARYHLECEAVGAARLDHAQRETYRAIVAAADEDER